MSRPLRVEFESALHHVTGRGNDRGKVFFTDADCVTFLELLGEAVDRFSWICHAYCLTINHYHLVIETPNANLSRGMRHINRVFTQRVNKQLTLRTSLPRTLQVGSRREGESSAGAGPIRCVESGPGEDGSIC